MKLRKVSFIGSGVILISMLLSFLSIWQVKNAYDTAIMVQENRQNAMNTVNDFRLQMYQLNRMLTAYISTADPQYLFYYYDLLAIQDGTKAAPKLYKSAIYWDQVMAGKITHEMPQNGELLSVRERMKRQKFSLDELNTLKDIFSITQKTKKIEQVAFAATQGLYDAKRKKFVEDGEVDLKFAASLIYGDEYKILNFQLSQEIDKLVVQTDHRTHTMVDQATARLSQWVGLALIFIILTVFITLGFLFMVKKVILSPIDKLTFATTKIAHGDYFFRIDPAKWLYELRQLGSTFNQMAGDIANDIANREQNSLELEKAKEMAEDATKAKSLFLATMSHELRTPLNAIIGMSYLALQTDLNPKQQGFIEQVNVSAKSLLNLINDLLDFSKIEAGKMSIEILPFNLNKLLQNTLNLHQYHADNQEITLSYEREKNDLLNDTTVLMGDALRVTQIVNNLLSNAIKFTHEGFVKLSTLTCKLDETNIKVSIIVEDSGIGMNEEQLSRLFQEFSQANSSTTRHYGGTGLGLAISRNLAGLLGGTLDAQSEGKKGSVFILELSFERSLEPENSDEVLLETPLVVLKKDDTKLESSKMPDDFDTMAWMKEFISLLETSNFDAIDEWDLRKSSLQTTITPEKIKKISKLLAEFEFEKALVLVKEINE